MRLLFALMVLYSHAFELRVNNDHHYIFERFHAPVSWGSVGVDGFFLLSGYLILESWKRTPDLRDFLRKRTLRIVPGYVVAVVLSVPIIGWIAPMEPGFFHHFNIRFPVSVLLLFAPQTPDVFRGLSNHVVNAPLWTITYEFRCYLLVAALGVAGLLRRRLSWGILTVFFFILSLWPSLQSKLSWTYPLLVTGEPKQYYRLVPIFLIGGCFALFRREIPMRAWLAGLSFVMMILLSRFGESFFALFLGYLLFYVASLELTFLQSAREMPDISYGLYLYGWPVECSVIYFLHTAPLATFVLAAVGSAACGWLSWHFVERPALKLKHGRRVELPAG